VELVVLVWLASAGLAGWIARTRGTDVGRWVVVGFLLGPLGVFLAAAFAGQPWTDIKRRPTTAVILALLVVLGWFVLQDLLR
jgi:uncharacterized membrane protein